MYRIHSQRTARAPETSGTTSRAAFRHCYAALLALETQRLHAQMRRAGALRSRASTQAEPLPPLRPAMAGRERQRPSIAQKRPGDATPRARG